MIQLPLARVYNTRFIIYYIIASYNHQFDEVCKKLFWGPIHIFQFTKIFQIFQTNQLHAFPQAHSYIIITNWELHQTYFVKYDHKCKRASNFLVDYIQNIKIKYQDIISYTYRLGLMVPVQNICQISRKNIKILYPTNMD